MSKLSDITSAAIQNLLGNAAFSKGILAVDTGNVVVKTTAAVNYTVNGVMYSKAATAGQVLTVTHTLDGAVAGGGYVQPAPVSPATSVTVYYTLGYNAAGALSVSQGTYAGQPLFLGQAGASAVGDGSIPNSPAGYTTFGVIKVVTSVAATFTPGTTALNATNVVATYFDIGVMPAGLL